MRHSSILAVVVGLGIVGMISLPGPAQSTRAAAPGLGPVSVTETNVDADGLIRVHEQGVANSRVTNLPLDPDGRLRIAGTVEIGKTANVAITNVPTVEIAKMPTVTITQPLTIVQEPAQTLVYSFRDAIPSGSARVGLGSEDADVTSVSFWASSDAHFQLSGGATFSIHVKAGTNVVHSFATSLAANSLLIECPGGCDVSISVVGHRND